MISFMQNFKKLIFYILLSYFTYGDDSWKVYDDSAIAIINIYIPQDKIDWMYDNVYSDSMHVANFSFQNSHIDESIDSIGFRLRGNTSRNAAKKSFKVDFNHFRPGRDFFGVEKLNLNGEHNDPSMVRSKITWDLYQDIGMASSRASHAELYINEEYYGLYVSVEHIDDSFIDRNYADDSGNLWKCIWPADLTYRGDDAENYHPYWGDDRPYELKTNKEIYDYSKLARLIRIIEQEPDSLEYVLNKIEHEYQIKLDQRYDFSNHFTWAKNGRPGGMKKYTSILGADFEEIYKNQLIKIKKCDTLVGIIHKDEEK